MEEGMKKIIYFFVIFLFPFLLFGDKFATTEDGEKVLLKDDGTWEFVNEQKDEKVYEFDFRKAKWGMTKKQVKKKEKGTIFKEWTEDGSDLLAYRDKLADLTCVIGYIFVDKKLVRGKYMFTHEHINQNDYIADYKNLKEYMEKKYSVPKEDKIFWKDDLYKYDYQNWGMAISAGHLVYYSKWETSSTEITLILSGDNFKINLGIEYQSKSLKQLEKEIKEKKELEDF